MEIKSIKDIGQDILEVTGEEGGEIITAQGWVSAVEKHVVSRDPFERRRMTKAEIRNYALRLLNESTPKTQQVVREIAFR